MKDEFGRRIVHTEKALYLTFKDGKLIETNNQFAVGDAKAYAARMGGKTMTNSDRSATRAVFGGLVVMIAVCAWTVGQRRR